MDQLLGLTSPVLRIIVIVGAVAVPLVAAVVTFLLLGRRTRRRRLRVAVALVVAGVCVGGQVLAMVASFLVVNDSYQFYASYGDLVGRTGNAEPIQVNDPDTADGGTIRLITVHGKASRTTAQVLAWLPPQYEEPQYAHTRFPVVEFLPGQPGQPGGTFGRFDLGGKAEAAIASHETAPFVLIVPPLMIRPPWDTECTDIPHGPRALSWLTKDVPTGVGKALRVDPLGPHWSVMGFSTGAFCAAKMMFKQPSDYGAAVGLGGYYTPTTEDTYPHLFGGSHAFRMANSPNILYRRTGMHDDHLLLVTGREDPESYGSTEAMIRTTADDPQVSYVVFPRGGHNTADYAKYVGPALSWLAQQGSL